MAIHAEVRNTAPVDEAVQVASLKQTLNPGDVASSSPGVATGAPAAESSGEKTSPTPQDAAVAAAVADGVTTGIAISAGAIEMNPLVTTTPVGLVALTGMKIGLVQYADTLPQEEKRAVMKTTSSVWGGAAVNNLLVLMAAPPPFPVIAGLIMGLATWQHMDGQYQKEDELIAERKAREEAELAQVGATVAEAVETSGN